MNRRGFLGSLAGLAVAPFLPKPNPLQDDLVWLEDEGGLVSMKEAAEAAGESFRMSKGLVGWEGIVGHEGT